ncbi:MAG: hypothetical protein AB7G21_10590 [Dehalococcoidia bacterium]
MTAPPLIVPEAGPAERARRMFREADAWVREHAVEPPHRGWRRLLLVAIVIVPMCFNAVALWPEVTHRVPNVNDDAFHYLMIRSASDALSRGVNVMDSWAPEMDLGTPRFLYYQNLPALFVIALDRLTFGLVGLLDLLNFTRWALMVTLPLTVYWSARRMELSVVASAGAAAAVSLLSADHKYGLEYDSYVWRGWGMYTQLWAIHLSFVTLACLWHLARTGRGAVTAIVAASALVLSHLLYAEMMVVTGALVFLFGVGRAALPVRVAQFLGVGAAIAVITSYLWFSYLQFHPWVGESPYDAAWKLDSFGWRTILDWLVTGELFDHGRWPVYTLALGVGAASLLLVRTRARAVLVALCVVWLVLYFGREMWGPLAPYIPAGSMLLFHRFIGSFHIAAVLVIGLGFEALWIASTLLPRPAAVAAAVLLCGVLLGPAILERRDYYASNAEWMGDVERAYEADPDIRPVLDTLHALPPGRVYAGLRANWGERIRMAQVPWYRVLVFEGLEVVSPPLPSITLNSDLMFHFNEQDRAMYELFDVRYVVAPPSVPLPDFLLPVLSRPRYTLYRTPSPVVAEFATQTVRRATDTKLSLFFANREWLLGGGPALRSFIRWDYPAPPTAGGAPIPGCADGTVTNEVRTPDVMQVDTTCSGAATLVFKATYHPNWRVTVDGAEQPAFMVSPSLLGVEVPAGAHTVRAEYRTATSRTALLAIGLGTLIMVLVGRRLLRTPRPRTR